MMIEYVHYIDFIRSMTPLDIRSSELNVNLRSAFISLNVSDASWYAEHNNTSCVVLAHFSTRSLKAFLMKCDDVAWHIIIHGSVCYHNECLWTMRQRIFSDWLILRVWWSRYWPELRSSIYKILDKQFEGSYRFLTSCNISSTRSSGLALAMSQNCKRVTWGGFIYLAIMHEEI